MTRMLPLLLLVASLTSRGEAQELSPAVTYGKWFLLAGSVGMNYLALRSHNQADDAFDALTSQCVDVPQRCALGSDGTYTDPETEDLYQTSLDYDRQARRWLIGGEAALVGAAALFVWELSRPKPRPDDIPFEPEVRSFRRGETGLGLRIRF